MPLRERGGGAPNAAKSLFEASWECDMPLTRRGLRGEVALDVAVQDFGVVTITLPACKVYTRGDASATHGALRAAAGAHTARRAAPLTRRDPPIRATPGVPLRGVTCAYGRSGMTGEVKLWSCAYAK